MSEDKSQHPAVAAVQRYMNAVFQNVGPDRNWPTVDAAGRSLIDLFDCVSFETWTEGGIRELVGCFLRLAPADDLDSLEIEAIASLQNLEDYLAFEATRATPPVEPEPAPAPAPIVEAVPLSPALAAAAGAMYRIALLAERCPAGVAHAVAALDQAIADIGFRVTP